MAVFGNVLRKYRKDNNITLEVMSAKLLMATSFLSNVELGKANAPDGLLERLIKHYPDLLPERDRFELLITIDRGSVTIPLTNAKSKDVKLATLIAKNFNNLPPEKKEQLRKLFA